MHLAHAKNGKQSKQGNWLLGWSEEAWSEMAGSWWRDVTNKEDDKVRGEPYSFPSRYGVAICVLRLLLKTKTQ